MKKYITIISIFAFLGVAALLFRVGSSSLTSNTTHEKTAITAAVNNHSTSGNMVTLPNIITDGNVSLERAISLRRSVRTYSDTPLTLAELGQLLWSAQGITNERGFRAAPSAGATFPLEMFVMVNNVEQLSSGIYRYDPFEHSLGLIHKENLADPLFRACLSQSMILDGGAVLIFAAVYERTTARYGDRGERYILNEVGHASQNVHLQAAALNLGTVVIGAYRDDEVEEILQLGEQYRVLYLMPVGKLR